MLTPDESEELRRLRRRAYAPGGGLTAPETQRLDELEQRRVIAAPAGAADPAGVGGTRRALRRGQAVDVDAGQDAVEPEDAHELIDALPPELAALAEPDEPPSEESVEPAEPATKRRGRRLPYLLTATALIVGFAIGFAVFGIRIAPAVALTADEAEVRIELEDRGPYDPGSVTAIGKEHGAVVWKATRDDGEYRCLIVTVGTADNQAQSCAPIEDDGRANNLFVGIDVTREGETPGMLQVGFVPVLGGGEEIMVQYFDTTDQWDWRSQYDEATLAVAERIVDQGIEGQMLELLGEDRGRTIWSAYDGTGQACLFVVTPDELQRECDPGSEPPAIVVVEDADSATRYIAVDSTRGRMLTIERLGGTVSIDDKTGEIEG